jgi:hypothetical protein
VALVTRPPGDELFRQSWPHRLDLALLAILLAFAGLVNAFAMTPPVYRLEQWLAELLNVDQEAIVLGLVFGVGVLLVPLALVFGAAWLNRTMLEDNRSLRPARLVQQYAYAFVPLGFGIWASHYLFHLLIGPLTIVPALQTFFADVVGLAWLGAPNPRIGMMLTVPVGWIQALQMLLMAAGLGGALLVGYRAAANRARSPQVAWREFAPWAVILVAVAILAVWVFLLPMEMRGNVLG